MDLTRLSVNMNEDTTAALRQMAARHGITYTEAIRRAISITKLIDDERLAGRTILSTDRDGSHAREWVVI